jgi:hypothetical protein
MKLFQNDVLNEATNDSAISNFKLSACHDHLPTVRAEEVVRTRIGNAWGDDSLAKET